MKKLFVTVVSLLFLANISYAQFAMPKISVHKKENKSVSNLNEVSFAKGINFFKLFWIFYIGCFLGVVIETIWCILTNGYFEYRTALILEPLNPVYGVGAVIISLLLSKMKKYTNLVLYFSSFIIGGLFEVACSIFQETIFGTVSWMYKPSNFGILGNRTSLLYCFLWGFLGIFWIRIFYPVLSKLIEKIPNKIGKPLTFFLVGLVCIDILFSSGALLRQKERRNQMKEKIAVQNLKSKRNRNTIIKKLKEHNIDKNAIIVCIGTPKIILDAVGPKVGQMLKNNEDILVYGTVDEPANAITIDRIRVELSEKYPDRKILAIDACLDCDPSNKLGKFTFRNYGVSPGAGVGKNIEEVGDVSLVVSTCSSENELFFSARNEEAYKDFIDDISKDIYEILNEVF